MRTHAYSVAAAAALLVLSAAPTSEAVSQSFSGFPAGKIVFDDDDGGGQLWPNFRIVGVDNVGGPDALIIFDSSRPPGIDFDLGTPNRDFGGPGVGRGGAFGMPGQNAVPLGNLLIIPEYIADTNHDGLVDVPNDEASGGCMTFLFDEGVVPLGFTLVDLDVATARFDLLPGVLRVTVYQGPLEDNAVGTVNLPTAGYRRVELCFAGSGGVARVNFDRVIPVDEISWGRVKSIYRR